MSVRMVEEGYLVVHFDLDVGADVHLFVFKHIDVGLQCHDHTSLHNSTNTHRLIRW